MFASCRSDWYYHQVCKMATGNNEMVSGLRQTLDKASLDEGAKLSHWEVLKIILKKYIGILFKHQSLKK